VLKDEVITIMFGVGFMQAYVWEAISVVAEFMVDVVRVEAQHMCDPTATSDPIALMTSQVQAIPLTLTP
jgi:hypothetical protein